MSDFPSVVIKTFTERTYVYDNEVKELKNEEIEANGTEYIINRTDNVCGNYINFTPMNNYRYDYYEPTLLRKNNKVKDDDFSIKCIINKLEKKGYKIVNIKNTEINKIVVNFGKNKKEFINFINNNTERKFIELNENETIYNLYEYKFFNNIIKKYIESKKKNSLELNKEETLKFDLYKIEIKPELIKETNNINICTNNYIYKLPQINIKYDNDDGYYTFFSHLSNEELKTAFSSINKDIKIYKNKYYVGIIEKLITIPYNDKYKYLAIYIENDLMVILNEDKNKIKVQADENWDLI